MRLQGGQSQQEKPDFHNFLRDFFGFCGFLAIFLGFWLYLTRRIKSLRLYSVWSRNRYECLYFSPKSTFFFGAWAATMGVLRASTTGAAILK